jgi:hypothetical protein
MEAARKDFWMIQPTPQETKILTARPFSSEKFDRISRDLVPQAMEDKWFIYREADVLHLKSFKGHVSAPRVGDGLSCRPTAARCVARLRSHRSTGLIRPGET